MNFDLQGVVIHLVVSTLSKIHRRRKKNSDWTYEESSKRYLFFDVQ